MSSDAEQAWRAIYRAYTRLAPTIDKGLKAAVGLTYSEYEALSQLGAAARPLTMADLATRVAVTRTHASRLVDSLEHAGSAKRESNPDDGRSILVSISEEGARRLQASQSTVQSVLGEIIGSSTSRSELRDLAAGVDKASAGQS
jgi:DNA-binding MarR family transcriptional regulator